MCPGLISTGSDHFFFNHALLRRLMPTVTLLAITTFAGAQAVNDDCANAMTIAPGSISGTTADALLDVAPDCVVEVTAPGVWYTFTGVAGVVELNTCTNPAFDTQLSVYSGSCGALQCVWGNDDACGNRSKVFFLAQAAQTYFVLVHGYDTQTGTFELSFQVGSGALPANDDCANATTIAQGTTVGSTLGALGDLAPGCVVNITAPGVWYTFTGVEGLVELNTCMNSDFDTQLSVYRGSCAALVCVDGNDDFPCSGSKVEFNAQATETYFVLVHGFGSGTGTFALSFLLNGTLVANEDCAHATTIAPGTIVGSTVGAQVDVVPGCGVDVSAPGVWYTFTGISGFVELNTCIGGSSSPYDSRLSVYSGSCASLVCLSGNDNACDIQPKVIFLAQAAESYYVLVHGSETSTGSFTLTFINMPPAANDDCASAVPITCGSSTAGSTLNATPEALSSCGVDLEAPGVWYTFTQVSGEMIIGTCDVHDYDSQINLFTGDCGSLTCVGGNDDSESGLCDVGSELAFTADPDLTYYALVQGYSGATGTFEVSMRPAQGSLCRNAVRAILGGAYDPTSGLMIDSLRVNGLLPLTEPYTALGYIHRGGGGNETTTADVLAVIGVDAVVDWVVLELRDPNDPGKRVASRSALLQRDGDVVGMDGVTPVSFVVPSGKYRLAIRHRNHLGVMRERSVSGSDISTDFTSPETSTFMSGSRKMVDSTMVLWPGDVTFDGMVKYTGAGNDRDPILVAVGSTTPNNVGGGYIQQDVNLSGQTKYTGAGNDRDPVLVTVGSTTPNAVKGDFLPDSLVFHDNVHFVDTNLWVLDTTLTDMDSLITMVYQYTGTPPDVQPGDIVVGPLHSSAYLRKVISSQLSGTIMTLITVQGLMQELVQSGVIMTEVEFPDNLIVTEEGYAGSPSSHIVSIPGEITLGGQEGSATGGIKFSNVQIGWEESVVNMVRFEEGQEPKSSISADGPFRFSGTARFYGQSNLEDEKTIPLGPLGTPFPIPVPFLPPGSVTGKLSLKIKWVIVGGAAGLNVPFDFGLRSGGRVGAEAYDDAGGMYTSDAYFSEFDVHPQSETDLNFSFNLQSSVEPSVNLATTYFLAGGPELSFGFPLEAKFSYDPTFGTSDIALTASMKFGAKFKVEAWGWKTTYPLFQWQSAPLIEYKAPKLIEYANPSGNQQYGSPGITLSEPLRVRALAALSLLGDVKATWPMQNVKVWFGDVVGGGSLSTTLDATYLNGLALTNWTLGWGPLSEQHVNAWARYGNGQMVSGAPLTFSVQTDYPTLQYAVASGNEQHGVANVALPLPIKSRVVLFGTQTPQEGISVFYDVISGGGSVNEDEVLTDAIGEASCQWTLGDPTLGPQIIEARAYDQNGQELPGSPLTFTAVVLATTLELVSGNNQSEFANHALPQPLRVRLVTNTGIPVTNTAVQFSVVDGGGSVSPSTVFSDEAGYAQCNWILGPSGPQVAQAQALNEFSQLLTVTFNATIATCASFVSVDASGGTYQSALIGGKCWSKQNLRTTKYANGDPITVGTDEASWAFATEGMYTAFGNNFANQTIHGLLYNGHAVSDPRGLCPPGWHIASDEEWSAMEVALGMDPAEALNTGLRGQAENVGGKLMGPPVNGSATWVYSAPSLQWPFCGTNESSFHGVPTGGRNLQGFYFGSAFQSQIPNSSAEFWTSTSGVYRTLSGCSFGGNPPIGSDPVPPVQFITGTERGTGLDAKSGRACRCVKDE